MRTLEDRRKQAQCLLNNAIAKRNRARQLEQEAEEEIIQARMMIADLDAKERRR